MKRFLKENRKGKVPSLAGLLSCRVKEGFVLFVRRGGGGGKRRTCSLKEGKGKGFHLFCVKEVATNLLLIKE